MDIMKRTGTYEQVDLHRRVKELEEVSTLQISEIVKEEGLDTGLVHIPTRLYDTLIDINTGEQHLIHAGVSNLIVIGFGLLVASLLRGGVVNSFPISYWAVGEGEGAFWDDLTQEQRQSKSLFTLTNLYDEVARVQTTNVFIDEEDNEVLPDPPTSRVEVRAVFGPSVAGSLREFGIFGGAASATLGSGLMLDHKSHQVLHLNQTVGLQNVLIRALRLTL